MAASHNGVTLLRRLRDPRKSRRSAGSVGAGGECGGQTWWDEGSIMFEPSPNLVFLSLPTLAWSLVTSRDPFYTCVLMSTTVSLWETLSLSSKQGTVVGGLGGRSMVSGSA